MATNHPTTPEPLETPRASEAAEVHVSLLEESRTNPRQRYDPGKLAELAESIRQHGLLEPLLVRPIGDPNRISYEIVAGARRFRAAQAAGLETVPVIIRKLDDRQALELQLVENLQREDLDEMEEALGFQALRKLGLEVATIAQRLGKAGKSAGYVYQRLKLADLIPPARKAVSDGKLSGSHAILIARLQPADQKRALEYCFPTHYQSRDGTPSVRSLEGWIDEEIHLKLDAAVFPKADAALVPEAGPCTTCPKNTAANPQLYPEARGSVCTDPDCYRAKQEAFLKRKESELAQKGQKPLRLTADYDHYHQPKGVLVKSQYIKIENKQPHCPSAQPGLVVAGHRDIGQVYQVCADPQCKIHHPGGRSTDLWRERQKKAEAKRRQATEARRRIVEAILVRAGRKLERADFNYLAVRGFSRLHHDEQQAISKRRGWIPEKRQYSTVYDGAGFRRAVEKMSNAGIITFLVELSLAGYLIQTYNDSGLQQELFETARRYGVDAKAIWRTARAESAGAGASAKKLQTSAKAAARKGKARR